MSLRATTVARVENSRFFCILPDPRWSAGVMELPAWVDPSGRWFLVSAARRGPTLFEAMSKAPQVTSTRPTPSLSSWWSNRGNKKASQSVMAQPLTEQEAMDELANRQAIIDQRRQAAEARRNEKAVRKAERTAHKAAEKAARAEVGSAVPRMNFSLSTAGCVGVAGLVCAIVLAAFSLGRHSKDEFGQLGTVAAIGAKGKSESSKLAAGKKPPIAESVRAKIPANAHPDLSELLRKPETKASKTLAANQPVSVAPQQASASLPEDLNYLQIESFLITRERNGEQLAADLAHVRKFLDDRGVRTFVRKRSNGFVLFCEQGVAPGKDRGTERKELERKIRQLGQEYRAAGGLYQFKGCFFVSYSSTKTGDPV